MKRNLERHFDGLMDVAEFVTKAGPTCYNVNRGAEPFNGNITFEEAVAKLHHGDTTGVVEITNIADKLTHLTEQQLPQYQWDVTGECFDVATMLTGQPEHWLNPSPMEERRVYHLIVNIGMLGSIDEETITNRGAAIIALIDKLQSDPKNIVELDLVSFARIREGDHESVKLTISMGSTPLDIDALAFAMAHPAFFRRILFVVRELMTGDEQINDHCYTQEITPPKESIYFQGGSRANVDTMNKEFATVKAAGQWISRQIEVMTQA